MAKDLLGEFEHHVLLALLRRGEEGYSVPIVLELEERTGREVAPASRWARTVDHNAPSPAQPPETPLPNQVNPVITSSTTPPHRKRRARRTCGTGSPAAPDCASDQNSGGSLR